MKHANTTAPMLITAATPKAAWIPPFRAATGGSPPSVKVAVLLDMIATKNAAPAAPATCWSVPKTALPWE